LIQNFSLLAKRDFGDGEDSGTKRKREGQIHFCEVSLRRRRETSGKKTSDKYIFVKSHFAGRDFGENSFEDEERLRRRKNEDEEKERIGQIHLCEVSLRGERLRGIYFADEERLQIL
jgi:hypothetical protein